MDHQTLEIIKTIFIGIGAIAAAVTAIKTIRDKSAKSEGSKKTFHTKDWSERNEFQPSSVDSDRRLGEPDEQDTYSHLGAQKPDIPTESSPDPKSSPDPNKWEKWHRRLQDWRVSAGITSLLAAITMTLFLLPDYPAYGRIFQNSLKGGSLGPKMIVIPAGEFLMGSPGDEPERSGYEGEQHKVHIPNPFAMSVTEVTFEDYERFAKDSPKYESPMRGLDSGKHPVRGVSWEDARAYAEWLSDQTGKQYRLPTEAEWEYAARAGTTTPFSTGDCIDIDQANYDGYRFSYANCDSKIGGGRKEPKIISTGHLPPNPWGLHEMHGNVSEWTADCWHDGYEGAPADGGVWGPENNGDCSVRVIRGGHFSNAPRAIRSAARNSVSLEVASPRIGIRLVREGPFAEFDEL